jgi:hypothetical protein
MADETVKPDSAGAESDASQNEKGVVATSEDVELPDPDAHLSEAERKAIVCLRTQDTQSLLTKSVGQKAVMEARLVPHPMGWFTFAPEQSPTGN